MSEQSFVIVENGFIGGSAVEESSIIRLVRVYLSRARAEEDIDLLRDNAPGKSFDIIAVEAIEA